MDPQPTADAGLNALGDLGQPARPLNPIAAAIGILKLDTEVMVRVSRDPMALVYGAIAFAMTTVISIVLGGVLSGAAPPQVLMIAIAPIVGLIASAATTGIVHVLAKVMFGATGTYVGLLRVLWLGSIVSLLAVIPIAGAIVSSIWSLLITMVTFQEVDEIERLQALGLSIAVGLGFYALLRLLA